MTATYINIKYMQVDVKESIKSNSTTYTKLINENPTDNTWLFEKFNSPFIEKKQTIKALDFDELDDLSDQELSYRVSVMLHQRLKDLPKYVLAEEDFWAWINFDLGYIISQRLIKISQEKSSTILNHYFFSGGIRRGLFFGVFARLYYRALLTYDEQSEDPYALTKHVNYHPNQIRNLTWRTYSNNADFVKKIIKVQIKLEMHYGKKLNSKFYEAISKHISNVGGTFYVDLMTEEELEFIITKKVEELLNGNTDETLS